MIVGIDLGTTNSLIAVWEGNGPRLIKNSLGEVLTPSCVSIDEDGTILVGRAARERLQTHPELTASAFKRHMGSNKQIRLGKRDFRAEELSALVLRSLRDDAEAALGQPVTEAIITVPAYFSDAQRKATRVAGELAGLRVERLLNEPTGAALAYGIHNRDGESRFLVFDLGGGTFDVSVLDLFEGVMEVRASAGDNWLGGDDFVTCLVDHFFEHNKLSAKLKQNREFMQRLAAQVEIAKRQLSESAKATVRVHHDGQDHSLALDEPLLERLCAPLLARLRAPVERALRDANLRSNELDNIVLAGGATRMPIVRRLVARMFGRFPASDINPDEVVALGAAVQAGLKMKDAALSEVVMTDVTPYSLGIALSIQIGENQYSDGHFDPVIERNCAVPISRVKQYFPAREGQRLLNLEVFQGEARMVKDNIHLGTLKIPLPAGKLEECGIDVRFTYDVNGLLQVETTVLKTGEQFSLIIEGNPGLLGEAEIADRLSALAELKIHPRDRIEHRTLLARAERLYQQLRGDQREWFAMQILKFEKILATQDSRAIEPNRKRFEEVLDAVERDTFINPPANQP
jgi:molecular chaperone HscC